MKLTKAGDYALRCILYLAKQPEGTVSLLSSICKSQASPKFLTAKVLQRLSQGGIVKSSRGAGGGYMLAKPASEISVLDVIECVEGPICLNYCTNTSECERESSCPIHLVWKEAQEKLKETLSSYNFENLTDSVTITGR